jgi:hypothetical protein
MMSLCHSTALLKRKEPYFGVGKATELEPGFMYLLIKKQTEASGEAG